MTFRSFFTANAIALCLTVLSVPVPAYSQGTHVSALPPGSSPHGRTYSEWSVNWWKWFLSIPNAISPGNGGPCETNQSGKVWFLAGLFTPSAVPVPCTVPLGTMLFFPVVNVECSLTEPDPNFQGDTPEERRSCASGLLDSLESDLDLTVNVDGRYLQNPKLYRTASPDFPFNAPAGAIFGIPEGSSFASADGYYVMLTPLTPGSHTIRVTASFQGQAIIDTTWAIFVPTGAK
jgi:hypothetical protein